MKMRLKIGVVIDQLLAGGVQKAAIEQVKELNRRGNTAKLLILMRKQYPTDFSYLVKNVPHQFLSDSYPLLFRTTFKFPLFSFLSSLHLLSPSFAPNVIKKDHYDILISWGTTTCLTTQAIYHSIKVPYIAVIHDPIVYILNKVYKTTLLRYFFPLLIPLAIRVERSFLTDAKKTILISNVHRHYIKKQYAIDSIVIPLGVPIPKKIPQQRGSLLLSFGRWQKEKNPQFLLQILKKLPEASLIIAGNWINQKDLKWFNNLIEKEGLAARVQVVPSYSPTLLARLAARSRVFIHPHFEAFGLAALEAASYGLPIIIPRRSGVTEKFTNGIHGFFPDKVTLEAYIPAIKKLLINERLAFAMGNNTAEVVRTTYSWHSNVNQFLALITTLLHKKPTIMVLETCQVKNTHLSGGDKLMEPMTQRLVPFYSFSVITSYLGASHWRIGKNRIKELTILTSNYFDRSSQPLSIFLTYCIRMYQTIRRLRQKLSHILYSSTNLLPDVLPAYYTLTPDSLWIARIHHLIPPPHLREGNMLVNSVAYLMHRFSLFLIKRRATIILVLNTRLQSTLVAQGFDKNRIKVLGGGVEYHRIASYKPVTTTPSFEGIFLGRLHPTKGIFDLVPIWKQVLRIYPHARLGIIGSGQNYYRDGLRQDIKKNRLNHFIKLLGYIPDEEVYRIFKKTKVFLFTDHEAGFGLAVAEAMSAGLPVVGYDTGIFGSVYQKGYRVVERNNYAHFATEICNLLINTKLYKKLSQEAQHEAQQFTWDKVTIEFKKLLAQMND